MQGHPGHPVTGHLCPTRPILRGKSGLSLVVLFRRRPGHVKPIHRRPDVAGKLGVFGSYVKGSHPIRCIPPFVVVLGARSVANRIEVAGATGREAKPQREIRTVGDYPVDAREHVLSNRGMGRIRKRRQGIGLTAWRKEGDISDGIDSRFPGDDLGRTRRGIRPPPDQVHQGPVIIKGYQPLRDPVVIGLT